MSISTGGLAPLPLRVIFRQVAVAGLDGLEVVATGSDNVRRARQLNRLAAEYHLLVRTVHQNLLIKRTRDAWCAWILEAADLAMRVEARHVVIHAPAVFSWEHPAAQRWLRTLEMAQRRLSGSGIRFALENNNQHNSADANKVLAHLADLAAFAGQHDIDLTYDTCHAAAAGVDVLAGWEVMAERAVNIHLSDMVPRRIKFKSALLRSLFSDHQLPGSGVLPLEALRRRLLAGQYAGAVTLEVSPLALPTLNAPRLQRTLRTLAQFGNS